MRSLMKKSMQLLMILSLLLALSTVAAAADTFSAQISLDNGSNYGETAYTSLEAAVAAANAATVQDTAIRIKFTGAQTFAEPTTVTLDGDVRMTAVGDATLSGPLTIDGGSVSRSIHVLQVDTAATLKLTGVTVQNFTTTTGFGAALRVEDKASTLTMTDCTIKNCSGPIGAIYVRTGGVVNMTNCTVEGNTCTSTNGGVVHLNATSSKGTFEGTTFRNNTAPARGSAISACGTVTVKNCAFTGNSGAAPGALHIRNASSVVTVDGCTFAGNSSTASDGAAIYVEAGTTTVNGVTMGGENSPYDIATAGTLVLKGDVAIGTIHDAGGTVVLNDLLTLSDGKKIAVDIELGDSFFAGKKMFENGDKFYIAGMDASETFAIHGRSGALMTENQNYVVEMGLAFHEKKLYTQYQQTRFSGGSASGFSRFRYQRREPLAMLGEISPQKYTWLDCSSFVWAVYNNTFSNFYEDSTGLFYPQTGEIMDMAETAFNANEIGEEQMFVYYRPVTAAERTAASNGDLTTYTKIANEIKDLLQPGDLVDFRRTTGTGHVVLYVGNGYTIECTGSDYDYVGLADKKEANGALYYRGIDSYLLNVSIASSATGSIFRNNVLKYVAIMRPLNGAELTVSDAGRAYAANSGLTAMKTALAKGQSVAPGETITYTITLDNDPAYGGDAAVRSVTITDPLSSNVSFVSATDDGAVVNGAVVFSVEVGANATKSVSYTVKVDTDATGFVEGTIGSANGIPFKCNDVAVGAGMTADQETALKNVLSAGKTSGTTALAWINSVYADVLGKSLGVTTDSELFDAVFTSIGSSSTIDEIKYSPLYKREFDVSESGVMTALVDDMYGGYAVYSQSLSSHQTRIRYVDEAGLKVGDVLATADVSGNYAYYIYRGSDMLKVTDSGTSSAVTETVIDSMPAMSRFMLLRPSLIRDVNYVAKVSGHYYETLEEAVAAARAIDSFIEIYLLDDVTYTAASTLTLDGETRFLVESDKDITISGPLTIQGDGEDATSLMFRVNGGKLTLDGVTLKDYTNHGTKNNNTYGGAIRVDTAGTVKLDGVTVENISSGKRGAFYVSSSTLIATDCTFKNNTADSEYGGAIAIYSSCILTVTDCNFIGNHTPQYGGAIGIANSSGGGVFTVTGCEFTGNSADEDGAAIRTNGGTLTVEDCLFEGNTLSGTESYGTIRTDGGKDSSVVNIKNSKIVGNTSANTNSGIGIHLNGGTVTLEGCTVTGNTRENVTDYSDILVYAGALTLKGENTIDRVKLNDAMTVGVSGTVTGSIGVLGAVEGTQVLTGTVADVAASAAAFDKVLDADGAATDLIVGADGVVCKDISVASYNGAKYETLTKALTAANSGGGTVTLLSDVTESPVRVPSGTTLDLAGKTLTSTFFVAVNGSHVVDSSKGDTGRLVCANPMLSTDNTDFPILTDTGYVFTTVTKMNQTGSDKNGTYEYIFLPKFAAGEDALGANGGEACGVSFKLVLTWTADSGSSGEKMLTYTDEMIKDVYANGKAFCAWITNYTNYVEKGLQVTVSLVSDRGIIVEGTPWTIG